MTDEIEDRRNAIELLLRVWADSMHDACACMGPQPGHDLCPCDERRIAVQYLEDSLKFLPPR